MWETKFPLCLNEAIMYNANKIVVTGQQAKKKPLVTSLLVERSYMWGWWCKADYDRFPLTGQVSPSFHHKFRIGERL
jgi:hypothetical protein